MAKSLKSILFVLAFALIFVFTFAGCGSGMEKFKDNPSATDVVTGNGSLAVTKGDYLYFANGYTSAENVDSSNYNGTVTYSSLYRIKLKNGLPESVYDEESEDNDGSRALKNVDVLVKKVVGFESTGLYIFGDYIYFASPSTDVNSGLEIESKKIMFFRTKIDRSTAPELLYKTNSENTNVSFNMLENNGDVFLMILDGTDFQIIKIDAKNKRTQTKVSENVSSIAFAKYPTSNTPLSNFNKDVYYTRNITESDKEISVGNVLSKFSLTEFKNYDKVFADNNTNITLKFASKDRLFFERTKADDHLASSVSVLCSVTDVSQIADESAQICDINYSDYALISGKNVIVNNGSALILQSDNSIIYNSSATMLGVYGENVYFFDTSSNQIKRANYQEKTEAETVAEYAKTTSVNCATIYGEKIYFFSTDQTNDSVYLHMIDLSNDNKDYFVGVLEKADYDTESDE